MIAATTSLMPLLRRLDRFVTRWHRLVARACAVTGPSVITCAGRVRNGTPSSAPKSLPSRTLSVLIESEPGSNLSF